MIISSGHPLKKRVLLLFGRPNLNKEGLPKHYWFGEGCYLNIILRFLFKKYKIHSMFFVTVCSVVCDSNLRKLNTVLSLPL